MLNSRADSRLFGFALSFAALISICQPAAAAGTRVELKTNHGVIVIDLEDEKAPLSVANFVSYVRDGFYDGTVFHRVIPTFMIQGGGFTTDYQRRPIGASIKNESDNGLLNKRGTVAMARTPNPHSATAQFFINVADNAFLDRERARDGWGYAVFGRVSSGMDVVDKIRQVPTGTRGALQNVPQQTVIIERASVVEQSAKE